MDRHDNFFLGYAIDRHETDTRPTRDRHDARTQVLEVDPDTQTMVLSVLATLPWHLKLIFAFLSDSIPIGGQRRRPYIYLGIVTCGSMWTLFGLLPTHPGLAFTSLLLFCATFGLVMIDVNVDAVVVERVSWEKGDDVGTYCSSIVSVYGV